MSETFDLVGKKKVVVDRAGYMSAPRQGNDEQEISEGLSNKVLEGNYFLADWKIDRLRVALGKNWDYRAVPSDSQFKTFNNNWVPIRVFYEHPLEIEYCGVETEVYGEGSYALSGARMKEKIVLSANINNDSAVQNDASVNQVYWRWIYFMKTGIIEEAGSSLNPLILSGPNHWYYDHKHEGFLPFTPEEVLSKQPAGQAFFADYKTYYNERIRADTPAAAASLSYEKKIGGLPRLQNSLPNIYGFLRLISSEYLSSSEYSNLNEIYNMLVMDYYMTSYSSMKNDLYSSLLQRYPFETALLLYGLAGNYSPSGIGLTDASKIVEQIVGFKPENTDMSALIEQYVNEWASLVNNGNLPTLNYNAPRMIALERIFTNLVFSPNTFSMMELADKYKNHFPFYCELNFTAKLLTSIGDSMKQLLMTRPLSDAVAAGHSRIIKDYGSNPLQTIEANPYSQWMLQDFIEFSSEDIYKDLSSLEVELAQGSVSQPIEKYTFNVPNFLKKWLNGDPVFDITSPLSGEFEKIENFTSYFRNDFVDPFNIDSEDNIIWKNIFGSTFYAKILDTYKNKKRTYEEIMSGAPAYTEDVFYRIQKSRKLAPTFFAAEGINFDEYEVVQNIIIPNTSDLDIVKYVDTQLKYSTDATYKYDVFATRIIFGSKYKYVWVYPDGLKAKQSMGSNTFIKPHEAGAQDEEFYTQDSLETGIGHDLNYENIDGQDKKTQMQSVDVNATLEVWIEPSIRLIDDKLFSTPEILIMDKPPVTPDINIVPYRAVNNRVKMLITGNSDRYREKPIIMLDSDIEEFEKVKAAQLSPDGKVEFGSDDPVKRFQIFRTQVLPEKYSDFELYHDINKFVFEEEILPNTKYYYTFRAIDPHNHVSNPTPVYEVELIDEKGAVRPIIRMISMEAKENKTKLKEIQKYIYIKPSEAQLLFSDSVDTDSIFSDSTTKKKYKMRLTSKGSGKKIDINFSFRKETQNET